MSITVADGASYIDTVDVNDITLTTKGDTIIRGATSTTRLPIGSADGMIPIVNANSTNGLDYFQSGAANAGYVTGRYYGPAKVATWGAGTSFAANVLYAVPIYVPKRQAFSAIGLYIATGTNVRYGIYNSANGVPTSLALDAGARVVSAAAQNDIAISLTLNPGWYWLAMVNDAGVTCNSIPSTANSGNITGFTDGNTEVGRIAVNHVYAALPDPFGAVTYVTAATQFQVLKV